MNAWLQRFHKWLIDTDKWNDYLRCRDNARYAIARNYKSAIKWQRRAQRYVDEYKALIGE